VRLEVHIDRRCKILPGKSLSVPEADSKGVTARWGPEQLEADASPQDDERDTAAWDVEPATNERRRVCASRATGVRG
jgi:hypothetical protein